MELNTISLRAKDREVYLDGIKKFMMKGIPVLIDGAQTGEAGLKRLFSPPEGTFYMADYVIEELPEKERSEENMERCAPALRETYDEKEAYLTSGGFDRYILKEIRFDQAYHS